jgi:hypothetical protein
VKALGQDVVGPLVAKVLLLWLEAAGEEGAGDVGRDGNAADRNWRAEGQSVSCVCVCREAVGCAL